eukprot:2113427-Pyramimonas_sp.AAC.1
MNIMTFHESFKVEFWGPMYNRQHGTVVDTRERRQVIIMPAYFRAYQPIASGRYYHVLSVTGIVMVALLVPERMRGCVTYRGSVCDAGATMLK